MWSVNERWLAGIGAAAAAALIALFIARVVGFPPAAAVKNDALPQLPQAFQFRSGHENAETISQDFQLFPRPVTTISFKAETTVPKSPPRPQPVEPERPRDICAKHGGRRIEFTRHRHTSWRCVYRKHRRGD